MKILHTSDWHLGRNLYGKKRYDEFSAFLDWLISVISNENVDIILIAGDIFDNTSPSNRAQELYYNFLCRAAKSTCRHIVIISGNHDSPTFLNAPQLLLRELNIHVIGEMKENIADEVLLLKNNNFTEAIICAVPYLRDKDIRTVEAGESSEDKNRKLVLGIKNHYAEVVAHAESIQQKLLPLNIPIIGMGHLFTAGGKTTEDDGVRNLYVGSLAFVGTEIFPPSLNYVALGHLHVPQTVNNQENIRYSGSPIPMGFGEAKQQKSIVLIDFSTSVNIKTIPVPCFQKLEKIAGNWQTLCSKILSLKNQQDKVWLEIEFNGEELIPDLKEKVEELTLGSNLEILRLYNQQITEKYLTQVSNDELLENLLPVDVFNRCLQTHQISAEEQQTLSETFFEILHSIQENDKNAE